MNCGLLRGLGDLGSVWGEGTSRRDVVRRDKVPGAVGPRAPISGGQLPLVRRLPYRRGFTNIHRIEYKAVNVERLNRFRKGSTVGLEALVRAGIIKSERERVKILGSGELKKALTVKAHKFSASARAKIEAAGGSAVEI